MGTRSITVFREYDEQMEQFEDICAIYRQMDGYPTGMGNDLKEILKKHELVNGFSTEKQKKIQHNGMSCLAAYVIGLLKWNTWIDSTPEPITEKSSPPIGSIYVIPTHKCMTTEKFKNRDGSSFSGAEWAYVIYNYRHLDRDWINLKVFKVGWGKEKTVCVYDGRIDEFDPKAVQKAADKED